MNDQEKTNLLFCIALALRQPANDIASQINNAAELVRLATKVQALPAEEKPKLELVEKDHA
jgi:hypothetical protein